MVLTDIKKFGLSGSSVSENLYKLPFLVRLVKKPGLDLEVIYEECSSLMADILLVSYD